MSTASLPRINTSFFPKIITAENHSRFHQQRQNGGHGNVESGKQSGKAHPLKGNDKQPRFTKQDIAVMLSFFSIPSYRNSHKHNICVDMLRKGYHKSFSELFALIQKWNASREAAGPGSAIWQQEPLEEQLDKLDQLQHFLTRAEAAQRAGQLEKATEHYEAFHHLTLGRAWKDEAGRTHNSWACEGLWRIYTLLADKMLENKEHKQAIKTLIKAFEMAKEAGDKKIEGKAAYRVGLAYQSSGDQQTAMTYLNMYMELSKALGDKDGLGKAYKAIANALESEGKVAESVEYLEKFVEVSQGSDQSRSLEEACMCLGVIFNSRGQYDKGCEYFAKAYEITRNLRDLPLLQKTQVYLGAAKARKMMTAFSSHMETTGLVNTEELLAWKDSRNDMFSDPSTVCAPVSFHSLKTH
ncbi:tetratricopeptide repeat protein 29 isoform X4 [Lepisosteus oculatus]|uniref:tetratricopeptide repeat protein 29 isoform X4 n=1 Tax=Lepisosteus oculatus TaxID=7918 RepID=UPI0035F518F6